LKRSEDSRDTDLKRAEEEIEAINRDSAIHDLRIEGVRRGSTFEKEYDWTVF